MPVIRFTSTVRRVGRRTILRLPNDAGAGLPSRGQVAVEGLIDRQALKAILESDCADPDLPRNGKLLKAV